MRRAASLSALVLVAALAGCGGSGGGETTTTRAAAPDPASTLRRLVAGDPASRQLLTPDSRKRVADSELAEGVAAFADDAPVRARRAGGDWAVAWVVGTHRAEGTTERMAYAVALRLTGGRWLAQIAGPVQVSPLGPDEGSRAGSIPQVAAAVEAPKPIVEAALWIDGVPLETKGGGLSSRRISIYGAPAKPLASGEHVAVAFATAGGTASARAWTFRVAG